MPKCDSPGPTTPRAASHAPAPEAWSEPCKHMLRMQPHFTCTGVYSHPQRGNHKCTPHTPVSIAHTLMGHISTHIHTPIDSRSLSYHPCASHRMCGMLQCEVECVLDAMCVGVHTCKCPCHVNVSRIVPECGFQTQIGEVRCEGVSRCRDLQPSRR